MRALCILYSLLCAIGCNATTPTDWASAQRDTLIVGVELTGSLQAEDTTSVGPPGIPNVWEFKIAALAPEGEVVAKGDMLVSFDPTELREWQQKKENERDTTQVDLEKRQSEIRLAQRDEELRLAEAEAEVRKATLKADQPGDLTGSLVIKKAALELEAATETVAHLENKLRLIQRRDRNTLAFLKEKVSAAEHEVQITKEQILAMTVTAPRAGTTIYETNRWNDEKTKVGDAVWKASNVMDVASLDRMIAEGIVNEADSAKLAIGQTVVLRLEAHPDHDVQGSITKIANAVRRKSRDIPTKVVSVTLSVTPVKDLQLRPGMRFRGEVQTEEIPDALLLPIAAVFGSRGGPVAYRKTSAGAKRTKLVLGSRSKRHIQVLEGLSVGDQVSLRDLSVGGR